MTALSLAVLLVFVWTLLFFAYYSAFLAFLGLLVFLPIEIVKKRYWLIRGMIFIIGLVLIITTYHYPIGEINNRIKILAKKPRDKDSLSSFSARDKIGIYGLNLMMGFVALPMYPEVAKETLMMVFPSPDNGVRTFYSDFAINSQKIQSVIKDFKNNLIADKSGKELRAQKRLSWSVEDYSFGRKEARYALALNPADISLKSSKKSTCGVIDISIKVKIEYPQRSYVTLLSKPELKIEEGLFWILQQTRWLHPYVAEWRFSIRSNDNRIK